MKSRTVVIVIVLYLMALAVYAASAEMEELVLSCVAGLLALAASHFKTDKKTQDKKDP